jgi:hypothetical protein
MVESQHFLEKRKTCMARFMAACVYVAGFRDRKGMRDVKVSLGFFEFLSPNRCVQYLGVPTDHVCMEVNRSVHHTAAAANAFQPQRM